MATANHLTMARVVVVACVAIAVPALLAAWLRGELTIGLVATILLLVLAVALVSIGLQAVVQAAEQQQQDARQSLEQSKKLLGSINESMSGVRDMLDVATESGVDVELAGRSRGEIVELAERLAVVEDTVQEDAARLKETVVQDNEIAAHSHEESLVFVEAVHNLTSRMEGLPTLSDHGNLMNIVTTRVREGVTEITRALDRGIMSLERQINRADIEAQQAASAAVLESLVSEMRLAMDGYAVAVNSIHVDIQRGLQLVMARQDDIKHREEALYADVIRRIGDVLGQANEILAIAADQRVFSEVHRSDCMTTIQTVRTMCHDLRDGRQALEGAMQRGTESVLAQVSTEAAALRAEIEGLADEQRDFQEGMEIGFKRHDEGPTPVAATGGAGNIAEQQELIKEARDAVIDRVEAVGKSSFAEIERLIKAPRHQERCDLINESRAMQSILSQYKLNASPPRLTPSAMDATSLEAITDLIEQRAPRLALECGSGVSTVWMAYALKSVDGVLRSLDHLEKYGEQTRTELVRHKITQNVQLMIAPLESYSIADRDFEWYASAGWSDLDGVDLLVVDGPPSTVGPMARYPALPLMGSYLSDGAMIIVDDAARKDEISMVESWLEEFPDLTMMARPTDRIVVLEWKSPAEAGSVARLEEQL